MHTVANHERYELPLDGLSWIPTGIDARWALAALDA